MHQRLLLMAVCWLLFGPGTVLYSVGVPARVDHRPGSPTIADPNAYIQRPMLDLVRRANQSAGGNKTSAWTSREGASAAARTTAPSRKLPVRIPCLRDFISVDPLGSNAEMSECAEQSYQRRSLSFEFGRHIGTRNGVLSDLDGVRVDYRLTNRLNVNGVAGYPALFAKDTFNTTRRMSGISADLAEFLPSWDLTSYIIEQHDNVGEPSRAVGGAIRYLQTKRSLLFYSDYDFGERSLHSFMASGSLMLNHNTGIRATLDIRNSPIQERQQNYLQQNMVSAIGWKWMLPSDRLKQLTKDSRRGVSTLALGLSHALSQRLTVSGDVAVLDAAGEVDSDGAAFHESLECFAHLRLTASNLMISGDSSEFDLRHKITDASESRSASITSRYDISQYWTINPRFSTNFGTKARDNSVSRESSSAVRMEYRWKSKHALQFELGSKWSKEESPATDNSYSTYFLALGYQTKF